MKTFNTHLISFVLFFSFYATASEPLQVSLKAPATPSTILRDTYIKYHFTKCVLNENCYADISIKNSGTKTITLEKVRISGDEYVAQTNCAKTLAAFESCTTKVMFRPGSVDLESYGRLVYTTDSGDIYIDLSGFAITH